MKWLLPLSILILFELIADIVAKKWSLVGGSLLAAGALAAYLAANTFWLFALHNGSGLGRGAVIFSVVSALLAVVIGVGMYNESITRMQTIGFVFGIASLVLIFWE